MEVLPGKHQVCQNLEHPQTPWFQTSFVHCFSSLNTHNLGVNSLDVHFETVKYHLKSQSHISFIFHIYFPKSELHDVCDPISSFPSPLKKAAVAVARSRSRLQLLHQHLAPRGELHEARGFQRFVALVAEPLRQVLRCAASQVEVGARKQHVRRLKC